MTITTHHRTRRLVAVLAGTLALSGLAGTAVAQADAHPTAPAQPTTVQATTDWLAPQHA